MRYVSLDYCVRSALNTCQYPIHWYLQGIKAASDCLREISFDSLKQIRTAKLPVSPTGTVDLPCDYVDATKVGVIEGQYIRPLTPKDSINRLQNLDASGQPINYPQDEDTDNFAFLVGNVEGFMWADYSFGTWASGGLNLYGFNPKSIQDGYKIIPERGQIQLDQELGADFIVLEYVSDGQSADNATKVNPYAYKTITSYIIWQFKEHNRAYSIGDKERLKQEFNLQHKRLRSRLNGLTKPLIQRIVRANNTPTIKG